jgi:hypothetical protein
VASAGRIGDKQRSFGREPPVADTKVATRNNSIR